MRELTLYSDGRCVLSENGNVLWSADADDDFQEEFGEIAESDDIPAIIEFLQDADYLQDNEEPAIVDETDPDDSEDDDDDLSLYDSEDDDDDDDDGEPW